MMNDQQMLPPSTLKNRIVVGPIKCQTTDLLLPAFTQILARRTVLVPIQRFDTAKREIKIRFVAGGHL